MLDIKFIRENPDLVKEAVKNKNVTVDIDELLHLDEKKRKLIQESEQKRSEQKKASKGPQSPEGIVDLKKLKDEIKNLEEELDKIDQQFKIILYKVPNIPLAEVPIGKAESENKIIREWGKVPKFDFKPRDHVELGEKLLILDIERAAKVTGARFSYLKGAGALLESALIQHTFTTLYSEKEVSKIAKSVDKNISSKPFVPVFPPVMIRPDVFTKMARLTPEDKDERYHLAQDDLYLIGSAEHTLGSMYMDEILDEKELPIRYIGFSTSFRREAGSYGKDTHGILRVHQFDKLEMESFTTAKDAELEHKFFIAVQEYLMQSLGLPYQVIQKCTADIGNPNASGYDINAWMPGQNKYRETHTADYMSDYQARRLNTKVRKEDGSLEFIHTNDATAFAIGRTIIAILENYQTEKGTVKIPKVLQKYMGIKEIK